MLMELAVAAGKHVWKPGFRTNQGHRLLSQKRRLSAIVVAAGKTGFL
jgi:hypothetical protein